MLIHYKHQTGGFPVFSGKAYQSGRGFGSVMSSMFRNFIVPMAKTAGKSLLRTGLRKTANIMNEVAAGQTVGNAIKTEVGRALNPGKRKRQPSREPQARQPRRQTPITRQPNKRRRRRQPNKQDIWTSR